MSEEQGKDSLSEMSVSEQQRERSDFGVSSSKSVKSDQLKVVVPLFKEETPFKSQRSVSPVGSCVSMKSDHSKGDGPNFSEETPSQTNSERSGSPVISTVSMKSDHSKGDGPNFSEETPSQTKSQRSGSPVISTVSMKSDHSKGDGPNFSEETPSQTRSQRSGSPVISTVSMKSDHSKGDGPNFSEKTPSSSKGERLGSRVSFSEEIPSQTKSARSGSYVSSSVKSNHSKGDGPNFSGETSCNKRVISGSHVSSSVSAKSDHSKSDGPNFGEKTPCNKSKGATSHSKDDGPNFNEKTPSPPKSNKGPKTTVNIGAEITRWKSLKSQKGLENDEELATFLLNRFLGPAAYEACQYMVKVVGKNPLLMGKLNLIEHKLQLTLLKPLLQDKHCKLEILVLNNSYITDEDCQVLADALNSNPSNLKELNLSETKLRDPGMKILSTLFENKDCRLERLKSKCVCITKEGCAALTAAFNSNPSNLRELDLSETPLQDSGVTEISKLLGNSQFTLKILRMSNCSITEEGYTALASALRSNPSHLIELDLTGNDPGQSGVEQLLDLLKVPGCKLKLSFLHHAAEEACQYVTGIVSKNPLLLKELNLSGRKLGDKEVNQISALLQDKHCKLTTLTFLKSSAAQEACDHLTKVLGTSPLLLKELDLNEDKLGDMDGKKLSALLMDSHNKVQKIKLNNCKLTEKSCSVLATVLSSKTILEEMDLNNSCLLDSGFKEICEGLKNPVCDLKILKLSDCALTEESYSVLASVLSSDTSSLKDLDLSNNNLQDSGIKLLADGLKVDCKLEKLRLSNCNITEEGYKTLASALRSNLIHLIELDLTENDPGQSGVKELDDLLQDSTCQLKTLRFLSPAANEACQYVTGIVGKNPLLLRQLNLSGHELGDTRVNQIAALLQDKHCKLNTLKLNNNSITGEGGAALTSALNSNPSNLIELDLSGNKLGNSVVKKICLLLNNPQCRLEKLRFLKSPAAKDACDYLTKMLGKNPLLLKELDLSRIELEVLGGEKLSALLKDSHSKVEKIKVNSQLTKESCSVLATVLSSQTILKEMDLNNSCLRDSGVKEICEGLKKSNLNILKFLGAAAEEACLYVSKIVGKNPLLLKELNLSERDLGDTRVNKISVLLQDKHCKLDSIQLRNCGLTKESCSALATVLILNPSLKELDMSNNDLLDSGVMKLQNGLENTNCKLKKLRLSDCSITEEGYKALASALRSNPSHLIELDLSGNDPGQSGLKELSGLLKDPNCQLKTLRFLSTAAEEACQYLTKLLKTNPLLLKELNLSGCKLKNANVNQFTALLQDKHYSVNSLM
ncbi:hypothetical protein Q8A67_005701 [Cirrhinus molitorella]|uniref:Uncharacterized protein n=1 Tax=Cirrhinus molitorella TaxID=172907 RepID=A0AA88U2E4_9TELE|nr:hypothetical protein Q8A67_005701 [Cirrhinus molitorella]